ncbi:MAG: cysteine hydrolase [Clostridia bacterium]|nr:cysteine hydrolase [Clostridia bacterium]
MKKVLVIVDMQKDFVDGSLGTPEAVGIVDRVVEKIKAFSGAIFVTYDTHFENYAETAEGKNLPVPHCIRGTDGWQLDGKIAAALDGRAYTTVEKITFGSVELPGRILEAVGDEPFSVELVGLCTDICVVSNALLLKAHFPQVDISVDSACCAGVTPATHKAALDVMRMCQIRID